MSSAAGEIIVLWKKRPNIILFTGSMRMSEDERIQLGPSSELTVAAVTAEDAGSYVCTVAVSPDPIELEHTVSVECEYRALRTKCPEHGVRVH